MKIRLLQEKDIDAAAKIVGANYSRKYQQSATLELKDMFGRTSIKPTYYVAEENDEVVGFAGFIQSWMDYNIYQIFWVNVDPKRQKQGIGQQLVKRIIKEIEKKKNADLILLTTSSPMYYRKYFGFKTLQLFHKKEHHLMALSFKK